jgi:hypothetical protein
MKSKLRKLRLIQLALIAVIPILGWVAEFDRDSGSNDWTLRHWFVTGLALWSAFGGFRVRRRLVVRMPLGGALSQASWFYAAQKKCPSG